MTRAASVYGNGKVFFVRRGKYTAYIVDDEAIRNTSLYAEAFSNWGVNTGTRGLSTVHFSFIPRDEIWIGASVEKRERPLIVGTAFRYAELIGRGVPSHKAYDQALAVETAVRRRAMCKRFGTLPTTALGRVPRDVYQRRYATVRGGDGPIAVHSIDGALVRGLYATDFVAGGHAYVYPWVPKKEIWIESSMKDNEAPVVVLHEFVERELMRKRGFPYVRAHEVALRIEFAYRGAFHLRDVRRLTWTTARAMLSRVKVPARFQ